MSQSMNDIKAKILSTQSMSKITKAMQMISAAKLAKSEVKLKTHQNYIQMLEAIIKKTIEAELVEDHVFFQSKTDTACIAYLVVTSDRGLAGGYNSKVLKVLQQELSERKQTEYKLYMIGKKAFDYARRTKRAVENDYVFIPDEMIYPDITSIINKLIADYANGTINEVVILYHDYLSKLVQEPTMKQVLPLRSSIINPSLNSNYLFNPSKEEMIGALLLKYLTGNIYGTLLTAKLAEHASRMNAMQNATDNATDIIKESQLIYNRARQAAITQEINEIVGGAVALK